MNFNVGAKRGFLPRKEHITLELYGREIQWIVNLTVSVILGVIHLKMKIRTIAHSEDAIRSGQFHLDTLETLRTLKLR